MILHQFECPQEHLFEEFTEWNNALRKCDPKPCPECKESADVTLDRRNYRRQALHSRPVVVYRDAGGHTIYPGSADEAMPDRYKKLGYERVEMDFHTARRFQNSMNKEERLKMSHYLEALQRTYEEEHAQDRSDLREAMRHMSPLGR